MSNAKGTSIKSKQVAQEESMEGLDFDFNDQLAIDPALKKEIETKGLVCRWINGIKYKANFGYDARRWQPYKRELSGKTGAAENNFGYADPEGFVRRGDMILAVRPAAIHNAYKERIASKNKVLSASQQKEAADQLRQHARDHGMGGALKVHEGYDEND
jgi:hypothetical protein